MHVIAYICLLIGLLCSAGAGGIALIQLWQKRSNLTGLVQYAMPIVALFLLLASALLLHALFWQDYSLEYVAAYTDRLLPVFYRLTAFWAGQPGSMLFWALATVLCGVIFMALPGYARLSDSTRLWYCAFFYAILAFFCLILTVWSNPFLALDPPPPDGQGLNPLLQNPGMIIHPPLLFMGYAAFTPVACAALGAMLSDPGKTWLVISRPFIIVAWILLTAGIVLGAWWAYMELGWGGYWGWDPVENASLLPWLAATAGLHVLIIQQTSGKLARAGAFLMALTVILSFFATYLTRSGVIQSVHAFGDGGVGLPLLIFVACFTLVAIAATLPARIPSAPLGALASREGALVITAWLFLFLALVITAATMWPVFSRWAGGFSQGLDAAFYNRVCLPLAAFLIIILCVCAWLGWKNPFAKRRDLWRLGVTFTIFLAAGCAIWAAGYQKPLPLVGASACIAALCASAMRLADRGVIATPRGRAAFGAHFGVALLGLGVAFSGPYAQEQDLLLAPGQTGSAGPYSITLESVTAGADNGYDFLRANLRVELDGRLETVLQPERRIYGKFGSMQFSEVSVSSNFAEDIYSSLLGMDEDQRVLVRITLEPLISLLWLGGALMCLLPLLGLGYPGKKRPESETGSA